MASVNFEKIKSVQQMKACLRHCDKEERLEHEHSNKHIDKSRTSLNLQGGKYADTCKLVDDRMAYFDSLEGQNKRKIELLVLVYAFQYLQVFLMINWKNVV